MEAILIKARYKVTHIRHAEENYAALTAVDVESREKDEYLLNVYEGEIIRRYVGVFDRLRHCPEYGGMFMYEEALVAMFQAQHGTPIDEVFFRGAQHDWHTRVEFAHALFHLALLVSGYPPEIGCAAFLSENLHVLLNEKRLAVSYGIRPMQDLNARELVFLAIDQVKKVLLRRYDSPPAEIRFLDSLEERLFVTPVTLYSHWAQAKAEIEADYEKLYAKGGLQRGLYLFVQNLMRVGKRALKRKR